MMRQVVHLRQVACPFCNSLNKVSVPCRCKPKRLPSVVYDSATYSAQLKQAKKSNKRSKRNLSLSSMQNKIRRSVNASNDYLPTIKEPKNAKNIPVAAEGAAESRRHTMHTTDNFKPIIHKQRIESGGSVLESVVQELTVGNQSVPPEEI